MELRGRRKMSGREQGAAGGRSCLGTHLCHPGGLRTVEYTFQHVGKTVTSDCKERSLNSALVLEKLCYLTLYQETLDGMAGWHRVDAQGCACGGGAIPENSCPCSQGSPLLQHGWGGWAARPMQTALLPVALFLPGEPQGRGSLVGCHLWGRTESDTTEVT